MDQQIRKTARMPRWLVVKIGQAVKRECSTYSHFMRCAAINELNRRKRTNTQTAA